jgi:hypothetical protein
MTIAGGCAARDPRRPARLLQTNRQQCHPGNGRRAVLAHTGRPGPLSGGMAAPVDFGGIVHDSPPPRRSWHDLHHADPTCARHGVGRGELDPSARITAILERLGWAHHVGWPTARRLAHLAATRERQG